MDPSPAVPERYCTPVRLDALSDALGFVAAACLNAGGGAALAGRMELVVEELFTNAATHGLRHGDGPETPHIWLRVTPAAGGSLCLEYQDSLAPFDPLAFCDGHAATDAMATVNAPPGGWGRALVARLASQAHYRRHDGRNVLTLVFAAPAGAT